MITKTFQIRSCQCDVANQWTTQLQQLQDKVDKIEAQQIKLD